MYIEVKFLLKEEPATAIIDADSLCLAIDCVQEQFGIDEDINMLRAYQSKVRDIYPYKHVGTQGAEPLDTKNYDIKGCNVGEKKTYLFLIEATSIDEAHQIANEALAGMDMEVVGVKESKIDYIML